jgi:site-specific recombinase XerD
LKKHQEIKEAILNLTLKDIPVTFDAIVKEIEPEVVQDDSFDYWFDQFYNSRRMVVKGTTLRHYVVVRNQTKEFNKGKRIKLSKIDYQYYDGFKNWLIEEKKQLNTTVNKRLKILKAFLRFCTNNNVFSETMLNKFKMLEEKPANNIALSEDELFNPH